MYSILLIQVKNPSDEEDSLFCLFACFPYFHLPPTTSSNQMRESFQDFNSSKALLIIPRYYVILKQKSKQKLFNRGFE